MILTTELLAKHSRNAKIVILRIIGRMDFLNQASTWKASAGRTHNAVINGASTKINNAVL